MIIEGERPRQKKYLDVERLVSMGENLTKIEPGSDAWREVLTDTLKTNIEGDSTYMLTQLTNIRGAVELRFDSSSYAIGFILAFFALQDQQVETGATDREILTDAGFTLFTRNLLQETSIQRCPPALLPERRRAVADITQGLMDGEYSDTSIDPDSVPLLFVDMKDCAMRTTDLWNADFEKRYGCDTMYLAEMCIDLDYQITNPEKANMHIASIATGILDAHELHRTSSNLETRFVVG